MRISDWSSDVCSSDLEGILADLDHILAHAKELNMRLRYEVRQPLGDLLEGGGRIARTIPPIAAHGGIAADAHEIAHAEIGRAHVCTPVTNAHLVCRLLLEQNKTQLSYYNTARTLLT